MRKMILFKLLLLFIITKCSYFSIFAQNVSVEYGALAFNTKEDYESIMLSDHNTRQAFFSYVNGLNGFNSLRAAQGNNTNFSSIPDSILIDVDFIGNVLNNYGVI